MLKRAGADGASEDAALRAAQSGNPEALKLAVSNGAAVISLIPTQGGNGTMEALTREGLFRPPTAADVAHSFALAASTRARSRQPLASSPRILLDPWHAH